MHLLASSVCGNPHLDKRDEVGDACMKYIQKYDRTCVNGSWRKVFAFQLEENWIVRCFRPSVPYIRVVLPNWNKNSERVPWGA